MQKQAPTLPRLLTMVIFALSCFSLLLFLWLSFGGPIPLKPKGYRVKVAFPEATQLAAEADVRASGVTIGKVRAKEVAPEKNLTLATLEIDPEYAPLRSNAKAQLRQKTLLGETFVELTLGSEDAAPIPEGGTLAPGRVGDSVQLDEILDALDPYTRKAFRTWQRDLGSSVQGRGRDLNDAFGNLPGFVEAGGDLFAELDQEKEALGLLVRNTGVVFGALTEREGQLRRLIEGQDDVFTAIANEQEAFAETWNIFPTFLDESKALAERLETFSRDTTPLVRDMQPALRDLAPTLRALGRFGPDLKRFFVNFDPLITISKTSLPATRDVFVELKPVLENLGPFLQEFNPILDYIGAHVYTLSDMFANLGVATSAKVVAPPPGQNGHYLRQFGPQGTETVAIHPNRLKSNRGNAYLNPLGVLSSPEGAKFKILPSFDCRNSSTGGEKEPGGDEPATPGCRVQKPFEYRGKLTERYPHNDAANYDK